METKPWKKKLKKELPKGMALIMQIKPFLKVKLVSRNSKLKLCRPIIRPIVVYGCEILVLKENIRQRLSVFERKILRKIFGPTKEHNGTRRVKTNEELDELIQHRSIVNYVRSQRLSWFGHINRMAESSIVNKIYKWHPFTNRPVGRPKSGLEDDVKNDLKKLKVVKWSDLVQDRHKWRETVEKAKTLPEL